MSVNRDTPLNVIFPSLPRDRAPWLYPGLFKSPSLAVRRGGGGSELWMLLPAEVSGSSVPRSCCFFKKAGLCPEEAEKFCPPDLRFPATRRDQDLSVNLRPEASRDPLGVEPPSPR